MTIELEYWWRWFEARDAFLRSGLMAKAPAGMSADEEQVWQRGLEAAIWDYEGPSEYAEESGLV
jgi:hypothetical protein